MSDVIDPFSRNCYLISKLHHQFDMIDQKHTIDPVTVVRNVFANDLPNADTFRIIVTLFRSQPIDEPECRYININPYKEQIRRSKIPSPHNVEDIAGSLNVDLSSTDMNVEYAANSPNK